MKKNLLWVLTLVLLTLFPYQNVLADYCSPTGTPTDTNNSGRYVSAITITDGNSNSKTVSGLQTQTGNVDNIYYDKTSEVFETTAGTTLTLSATENWGGAWQGAYVYIDYDCDKTFDTTSNTAGTGTGELLVSLSGAASGSFLSSLSSSTITLPANLAPGDYRLRFKSDYNSTDPCGGSSVLVMVDVTIRIPGDARTLTVLSNSSEAGTVSGGGTISGGTVITATANSGYEFINWTDENGNEVSTSTTFDNFSAGDKTYKANFRKPLTRSSITASSEETSGEGTTNGRANCIIDGSTSTFWHTQYTGGNANPPHWFMIDLGSEQAFDAFNYVSRGAKLYGNGAINEYKLYVSNSSIDVNNLPEAVAEGTFEYQTTNTSSTTPEHHNIKLANTVSGRYVMLYAVSTWGSASNDTYANCAEFYLYQYNFDVTIGATAGTGGSVQINGENVSSTTVSSGASVTLTANANEDYGFVNWTNSAGTVVSTDATYTFNATTTDTYTANFAEKIIVTISSSNESWGTVRFSDAEGSTKEVGSGASVTIVAEPTSAAYKFVQWEDGSTSATRTIDNITVSATYTATFAEKTIYTVTVNTPEVAGGSVSYTVNGVADATIYEGDELVFTALENDGYIFVEWSDGANQLSTDNPYTTTATANMTIVPVYKALKQFTINIEQPTGATITVVNSEGNTIETALEGDTITCQIEVESGYQFNDWLVNGGNQGSHNESYDIILTEAIASPLTITADVTRLTAEQMYSALTAPTFSRAGNMLSATGATVLDGADGAVVGTATNSTVASPQPMYVSPEAQFDLQVSVETEGWYGMHFHLMHNTVDNIIASYGYFGSTTSASVSTFWSGVSADTRLTANSTDNTITFPIALSSDVKVGDIIVLRAIGSSPVDPITPVGSYTEGSYVDFLFQVVDAEVTATANPTAGGTVSVSPAEIKIGTEVTLTAEPKDGYAFANWTDANDAEVGTDLTYTFPATKTNTYTANFAQAFTVSIASANETMGTVAFADGTTESKEVASGTEVTVVATPAAGYKFVSWSNNVNTAEQTVTITEDITLTATFAAKAEYNVTVTQVEGGSVTYTVGGEVVDKIYEGDEVTFTATPTADTDYIFVKWVDGNGNQLSTENPYTVTVSDDITIAPVYELSAQYTHDLFNTSNGSSSIPTYRIPAIAKTVTGRLIAVASHQVCGTDPGYGEVDIACRMSDNNGKTWTDKEIIADGDGVTSASVNYFTTAFGDAAIVADREKEEVIIVVVAGCTVYNNSATTRSNPNKVGIMRSTNNGDTWSEPEDITEAIYGLFDDGYPMQSAFVASGKIFQSRVVKVGEYYRIYAAMCARPNGNRVIYSDDFGRTWRPLGGEFALPVPDGDEPKCEEMPDGRVIISSRKASGRYYNIYTYTNTATAAGSWGTVSSSSFDGAGRTPGTNSTNGEILIVPVTRTDNNTDMYLALQSIPTGTSSSSNDRSNVCIYYKELTSFDDMNTPANLSASWDGYYHVTTNTSAYSTMVLQDNGRIAFFYEDTYTLFGTVSNPTSTCFTDGSGTHNYDGYNNIYTSYEIEDITNNAYTLNLDINRGDIVKTYLTSYVNASSASDDVKSELNTKISGFGDDPTPAEVDEIYSVLNSDPWDGKAVTFTNVQQSGTYTLYINDSGELATSSSDASTLGTSAQFECIKQSNGKYTFYNAAKDVYMIWRSSASQNYGQNSNKGTMTDYDATYCDWTFVDANSTSAGTYYMYAKRSGGTNDGSLVLMADDGDFDSWDTSLAWSSTYSNLYRIDVLPESDETKALIASAKEILAKEGVGYPSSSARSTLSAAITKAEANPYQGAAVALQSAIDAYYASTDVVKPVADGKYAFIVGHATKYYIYNNEGTLSLASYTEDMELPETAKFTCELSGDYYMFKTSDNKYMAFPSYGTENYSDASADGLEDSASDLTKFSIAKLYNNINANVTASNADLFGKIYLTVLLRGHKNDGGTAESGVFVVKTTDGSWDGASTPYDNGTFSSAISIVEVQTTLTLTATVNTDQTSWGTATVTPAEVEPGGSATFTATPNTNFVFDGWYKGEEKVSTEIEYTVENITESLSLEARFAYKCSLVIEFNAKRGSVTLNGESVVSGETNLVDFDSQITLVATPNGEGYSFEGWEYNGVSLSTNTSYSTNITENRTYTALFSTTNTAIVTFATNDNAMGSVTATVGENAITSGDAVEEDAEVILTATANDGYRFVEWSDGDTTPIRTVTASSDVNLTATFELIPTYIVTVSATEGGNATVSKETVQDGEEVTLTAVADEGYDFVNWTLNGAEVSTEATYTFSVISGKDGEYVANFELETKVTISVTVEGEGTANVNGEQSVTVDKDTEVTLTATEGAQTFVGWELNGVLVSDATSYTITATDDVTYTAVFAAEVYSLQVQATTDMAAEDDRFTISQSVSNVCVGSKVILTAEQPTNGYNFVGWYMADAELNFENNKVSSKYTTVVTITEENLITDYGLVAVFGKFSAGSEMTITADASTEVTVTVTTDTDCTISANGTEISATAGTAVEITATTTEAGALEITTNAGTITSVDCGESVALNEVATSTLTELVLRNVNAPEVAIEAPQLEKITVVSEAPAYDASGEEYDYNVATLSAISDLSMGVQVVVEKEINTPQPIQDKGTPSYFNFLSMPFAFNTADIKYWDGDSWEPAVAETHVRIMTYNSEIRAQGKYGQAWEKVAAGESIQLEANQGFVIVGNNNYGGADADYKMKLQFSSAEAAYSQDGSIKSVTTVENNNGGTSHMFDENWNHVGVPYLTKVTAPEGKTIYTHNGYSYESYTPAESKILAPYQGFMLQSVGTVSLEPETAVAALSLTKASESVYAQANISVDESAPAKIILSDESSENFVVNEDAWYMAPTANAISANYFVVDGMQASVTVQPEATELPMTVYAGAGTTHTISLTRMVGENNVYLKDAVTDEVVCLNDEDYTFEATPKTTIANRFTISMTEPTGIEGNTISTSDIKVVVNGDNLTIYGAEAGEAVTLYTTDGVVLATAVAEDGATTIATSATGVVVVKAGAEVVKVVK